MFRVTFPPPPAAPGLSVSADGIGVYSIAAPRAERIELCVFDSQGEHRFPLSHVDQGVHWGHVEGLVEGARYGLRVYGPWDPGRGLMFNPDHVLIDPFAHGVQWDGQLSPAQFSHVVDSRLAPLGAMERDTHNNAANAILSVVTNADTSVRAAAQAPKTPWNETVIYETHVKGFSALNPEVPEELRGTYAGLAHPASLGHLTSLGITAVQLLPIHAKLDEPHLHSRGLKNYWGYNTLSFFAPEPSYATAAARAKGPGGVLREVQEMVAALHRAGIEVFLDVVYNHTCEGDANGPIVSLRGIDAEEYYWRNDGHLVDVTGTGNTVNMRSPHVVELILRSLRFWTMDVGVDGFRFDLAATLGRSDSGFHADHPLLRTMLLDPELNDVKLIAEPWDVGSFGWQTGNFPPGFAEWNDAFRDDVRGAWLGAARELAEGGSGQPGWVRDIATRMTGSADIFRRNDPRDLPEGRTLRAPWASINFVTAHDGFTLHDLTAYNHKHNDANGENNRDGTDHNLSFNHGVEGETDSAEVTAARDRTARNLMATLLLSAGVPMLTAGDEFLRSQQGNNNAYSQDSALTYLHWEGEHSPRTQRGARHLAFTRRLIRSRRRLDAVRAHKFFTSATPEALAPHTVAWFRKSGQPLEHDDWFAPNRFHMLALLPTERDINLLVFSHSPHALTFHLPDERWCAGDFEILSDSSLGRATLDLEARTLGVEGPSVIALRCSRPTPPTTEPSES